jgi:hypothetical protein
LGQQGSKALTELDELNIMILQIRYDFASKCAIISYLLDVEQSLQFQDLSLDERKVCRVPGYGSDKALVSPDVLRHAVSRERLRMSSSGTRSAPGRSSAH